MGWIGLAAAAGFALAAVPAWRHVPLATEIYEIDAPEEFASIPLEIRLDRPEWMRTGEAATLRLEVIRVGAAGQPWPTSAGVTAASMVARFRAGGLSILPGGDQTAPLVSSGNPESFVWTLQGEEPRLGQATLSLSWRQYLTMGGTSESLLWVRVVPLEVRHPSISAFNGLLGVTGGLALWLLTRRTKAG